MGIGSNIHHNAHHRVTEAAIAAPGARDILVRNRKSANAASGPAMISHVRIL